mmetsp:Transcript_11709/g.31169  ORF Transcript_11709/g.31169 Transcript_11709/m.31169 type:complete len:524 (-) Transcript_11709:42-1613(-)
MAMARASEPPRGIGKRRRWDEPIEQKAVASVAQRDALVGDERLAIAEEGGRVVVLLQVGPQLPHEPEDRPRPQGVDRAVAPLDRIDAKPLLVDILVWRRVELVTAKVVVRRVPIAARDVRLLCATLGRKIRARIRGRARRLRLGALPKLVDPRHQETANGRALPPAALRVLAHFVVRTKVLNLLGQIASVRRLHPAVLVRLTVLVFGSVEAGVLLIRAAGVVEGVDAILGEQNRLGRGVAHRLEKVSKRDATVHLCCPRVERLRRVARTVHLVIQRIDVRKRRHHEDVGHLLGCARRIVDQREQPLVHATRGLVAARGAPLRHLAGLWRRALVDPAPAEVVVPLVPCASVALGALAHVCSFGQLLQKAVPDAVELVAETPDEHRRVRSVLTHLPRKLLHNDIALRLRLHCRFGGIAHVEGGHQVEAMRRDRVHKIGVIVVHTPAVHTEHVCAHRPDERQVAQPDEAEVSCEVVAVRLKVDRLVDGHGRVAYTLEEGGLAIEQELPTHHLRALGRDAGQAAHGN